MTEQELRALVREAVARHIGGDHPASSSDVAISPLQDVAVSPFRHFATTAASHLHTSPFPHLHTSSSPHPSHLLHAGLVNVTDDCVIEPAVKCDHCGYCKSHGH